MFAKVDGEYQQTVTTKEEPQINELVYQLCGLTEDEVRIVERIR
jgi:hypothetical protein